MFDEFPSSCVNAEVFLCFSRYFPFLKDIKFPTSVILDYLAQGNIRALPLSPESVRHMCLLMNPPFIRERSKGPVALASLQGVDLAGFYFLLPCLLLVFLISSFLCCCHTLTLVALQHAKDRQFSVWDNVFKQIVAHLGFEASELQKLYSGYFQSFSLLPLNALEEQLRSVPRDDVNILTTVSSVLASTLVNFTGAHVLR